MILNLLFNAEGHPVECGCAGVAHASGLQSLLPLRIRRGGTAPLLA